MEIKNQIDNIQKKQEICMGIKFFTHTHSMRQKIYAMCGIVKNRAV